MRDQFLTPDFWKTQFDVIGAAPWLVIPLLVVALVVAWWLRGQIDDREIRGLRAEKDASRAERDVYKKS
jgi:hypothetical protein